MKKIFFSLLAIAAIASCAKTADVYTEENAEILLSPVAALQTKAEVNNAIDGTEYPAAEHFTVIGYWANEPAGSTFAAGTTYLSAVDFAKKNSFWAGADKSYYWPKNGSLRFACYSPTVINGGALAHDLATDTWTATGYTQSSSTASTIDFMVAETPASYTAATAAENVSVVFEHALSWITLKVKAADAVAAEAFTINKVTINDVNTVADMVAAYPAKVWSNWSVPADYVVYSGAGQDVTETVTEIETTERGTVIIPQATTTVTVDYTQNALDGTPALENQSVTVSLALDAELTPWEPGKHYVYTLIFSLDEILINPSVVDWTDEIVNNIPAGATEVATEAELLAAAAKGGDIVLTKDINITEALCVENDATIDLNGHKITAESDYAIKAFGGELTLQGEGSVTSPHIAVCSVGGNVNIKGGNYVGGKDGAATIYAFEGTINISGGSFEATEESAGMNQYSVLNCKDGQATIVVTGGTFKNFNPADNNSEGPHTSFLPTTGYQSVETAPGVWTVKAE